MNSTTWTDAPAGFSGPGRIGMTQHARTSVLAVGTGSRMAPQGAPVRETGVPAARLRLTDEVCAAPKSFSEKAYVGITAPSATTDNNDTPLGIHPPGRPQS